MLLGKNELAGGLRDVEARFMMQENPDTIALLLPAGVVSQAVAVEVHGDSVQ